jgi:hypothetical protein
MAAARKAPTCQRVDKRWPAYQASSDPNSFLRNANLHPLGENFVEGDRRIGI